VKNNDFYSVFFLIGSVHGGGAEKQCLFQANLLAKLGRHVTIFVLSPLALEYKLSNQLRIISLCDLSRGNKLNKLFNVLKSILVLRKCLQKTKHPVTLYAWLELSHFMSIFSSLFTKAKLIWAIRNSNMNIHKHYWKMNVLTKINSLVSRYIDLFIANSYSGLTFYREELSYKMKDSLVIQNSIDNSVYYPLSLSEKNELRSKLGLSIDKIIILTASRVDQIKNLGSMIKAIALLKKHTHYNFRWIHLGAGKDQYVLSLREQIKHLGLADCISFLGATDNVSEYMKIADLFVLSSLSEGLSNSLLEAISCRAFCISTDVGDSSKFLDNQSIIQGFSHKNIAKKIQWALALPEIDRENLIEKAFSYINIQCDPKKNQMQLYTAIKSLQEK